MKTRGNKFMWFSLALALTCAWTPCGAAQDRSESDRGGQAVEDLLAGRFQWKISGPLVAPAERPEDPCYSIKDPTVVFHRGRWHLFCTIRSQKRSHQIEYLSFADWKDANAARRHLLKVQRRLLLCPAGLLLRPAQEVVPDLPGQRQVVEAEVRGGLRDHDRHRGPRLLEQAQAARGKTGRRQGRAGLLDHLRRPEGPLLLHHARRPHVARGDPAGGFPRRLVRGDAGDPGRHLRGQPHLQAQGAGQVPDPRRGPGRPRLALLQGVSGRPARRRVEAAGGHQGQLLRQHGQRAARPASDGPTPSATASCSAPAWTSGSKWTRPTCGSSSKA